ncbi:MAG: hypothetical protein AAFR61_22105 [Bacteroidota bacterium]
MVFTETPFYKAWAEYNKAVSHRFYEYSHSLIHVLMFGLLMMLFGTPRAAVYNGVDIWFVILYWLRGYYPIFLITVGLLLWWGDPIRLDLSGVKDAKERQKDRDAKKKNKNFKPKAKQKFRPNWYYWFFQIFEGFIWGTLAFILVPVVNDFILRIFQPDIINCIAFDTVNSERSLHTNVGQDIAFAFGSGFYEEIIFRGLLFMLIIQIAKRQKFMAPFKSDLVSLGVIPIKVPKHQPKSYNYYFLVGLGILLYAFSHYFFRYGDHLCTYSFFHRVFFGLTMYIIFTRRKIAVAAWSHTIYDLWYFSTQWID